MADDGEETSSLVRDYFIKNGGKVKRQDLFDHFRSQLDECSDQGKLKNQFGDIVNSLAFLQNIEGEKYFVLKKSKNGTTPVMLRRLPRPAGNQRKDKGVSLPSTMRNFRFSSIEDASGNTPDNRASSVSRHRAGLRSDSTLAESPLRRNSSDTSISENGHTHDSGVDTAASSLQSESPKPGLRHGSLPRNAAESDQLSQHSTDTGISNEDDQNDHDVPLHVLDGFEKSWMMSSMKGIKSDIVCHLEQEPSIVNYKDFFMGTGLHWAAKQGNVDVVHILISAGANVNSKSNGYTPLHLAAVHGHINIMNILIDEYHVDVHIRDHSGKEPKDVVQKNSPDQIKLKLKDPVAALALQDLEKKLPSAPPEGQSNLGVHGGLIRSSELNESTRFMPKLRAGSFRFLKKPKKFKKDRPVIEHWDSSRQERLESTLGSDEKQLYKMQRSNSGSLFPTYFYRAARATSKDVQGANGEKEPEPSPEEQEKKERAEILKCRSYPENEFRDITRINEENVQDVDAERSPLMRSPSGSVSSSSTMTYVEPEESLLSSVLGSFGQGLSHTSSIENEKIKRRSQSEDNLSTAVKTSSFNDEIAPRLKSQKNPSEDGGREFGDELATLMTMPKNVVTYEASGTTEAKPRNGILRNRESSPKAPRKLHESSTKAPEEETTADWKKSSKDSYNSNKISEDVRPFLTYGDEYSTTLTFPNKQQQEQQYQYQQQYHQRQPDQPTETTSYRNDQRIQQFNNNYEQVSDILDSKKPRTTNTKYSLKVEQPPERNFATFSSADSIPVRPPRKKDTISKNFAKSQENHDDQGNHDFDSLSEFLGNEHAAVLLSSSQRYSEPDSVDKTVLGNSENRRTSDPAYSENKHNENMNERHSQDFSKSNSEVPRRRSEGYVKVKEISLDHPRRRTDNNFPNEPEAVRVESGNKRVLPDVLLDTSAARPGSDGHKSGISRGGSGPPAREAVADRSRDEPRVLPPYRPPLNMSVDPKVRRSREFPSSSENTTSNTRPPSRPSYPPPSVPSSSQRSQEPGNYKPSREEPGNYKSSREVSLDHPRRRSMNYLSTDPAGPTAGNARRKSDGADYMRYPAHDASLDEIGLSTRQWTGENSTTRSVTSAGNVARNREPRNYPYPVDNTSNDRRVSRDQTETQSSSDAGNYRNMYDVSKRNGLPKQSGVDYEQEMATVLVPRSDRDSGAKTKVSYDGEPGYIVAKQVPSDDGNEAVNQSESNDDLDLLSSFLGEDMTSKWFSDTSSNAMTSEAEQKQMYRVTSMI